MFSDSDWIALAAFAVSGLAAAYARWSAKAAERANRIAIHNEKIRIYRGLLEFRAVLATRGPGFPDEDLWKFHDLVTLSEFYFSDKEYAALQEIVKDAHQVKTRNDLWKHLRDERDPNAPEAAKEMHALHRGVRDRCEIVAAQLKPGLKLEASQAQWKIW